MEHKRQTYGYQESYKRSDIWQIVIKAQFNSESIIGMEIS